MPDEANAALLILRVILGLIFIAHGVKHARGREKTTNWFGSIGFERPGFQWFMSTATEIGVGVLLVLGLLTTLATAGVVGIMFVAFWTVHRFAGFWVTARPDEGWEYVLALSTLALGLAMLGPGEWSLDEALGLATDMDGWVGAAIFAGGILVAAGQIATFWRPDERKD